LGNLNSKKVSTELKKKIEDLIFPSLWYEAISIIEAFLVSALIIGFDLGRMSFIISSKHDGFYFGRSNVNDLEEIILNPIPFLTQ
jgi:hypothetical protein